MTLHPLSPIDTSYSIPFQPKRKMPYYSVLDGWRGIGIVLVLCAHMLPVGPSSWNLNKMVGRMGMSVFFALSGFLIATILIYRPNIREFIVKRVFRILPLAWIFLLATLPLVSNSANEYFSHFLFYENLLPEAFTSLTAHYWSLCIEIQFYVLTVILYLAFKDKSLKLFIPLCLLCTALRISMGEPSSHVTFLRVDEVMVGCILALAKENLLGSTIPNFLKKINPLIPICLLPFFCHPALPNLGYFRAYVAVIVVGSTIYQNKCWISQILQSKILKYLAQISYGLYVIHPLTYHGWLGSGGDIVRYAKRPISFALTFVLAHLSTFHYEKYWNNLGKHILKQPKMVVAKNRNKYSQ